MTHSPSDVVLWARSAFRSNPGATDDELVHLLAEAGLPQAGKAVVMLVLAYGRLVVDKLVEVPLTFVDEGVERVFADDPMYAAAHHLALTETNRDDVRRIGMHSSEVGVVNEALTAGHKAEDMVLSPPVLFLSDDRRTSPLPDPQEILDALVRSHGSGLRLVCEVWPGEVVAGRVQAQLDIVATIGGRRAVESFAGVGSTIRNALGDAFTKFTQGSLHVLIATLDRPELGGDGVTWETWGDYHVCLGPLLRMWSSDGPSEISSYLDGLRAVVTKAQLAPEIHWLRTFVASDGRKVFGHEVLLDNESWRPGVRLSAKTRWPRASAQYALRQFTMLQPVRSASRSAGE